MMLTETVTIAGYENTILQIVLRTLKRSGKVQQNDISNHLQYTPDALDYRADLHLIQLLYPLERFE